MRIRLVLGVPVLSLLAVAPAAAPAATISVKPSATRIRARPFSSRRGGPSAGAGTAKVTLTARTGGPPRTFGVDVLGYVCWNGTFFGTTPQDQVPKPSCFGQMVGDYAASPSGSPDDPVPYADRYAAGRYKAQAELLRSYERPDGQVVNEDPVWSDVTSFEVTDECDWRVVRRGKAVSAQTPGDPGDPWPCNGDVQFFGPGPDTLSLLSGLDRSRLTVQGPDTVELAPLALPHRRLGLSLVLDGRGAVHLASGRRFGAAPGVIRTAGAQVAPRAARRGSSRANGPIDVAVAYDRKGTTTVRVRRGTAIVTSTSFSGRPHGHDLHALCVWGKSRAAIVTAGHFTRVRRGRPPAGAVRQARRHCRGVA